MRRQHGRWRWRLLRSRRAKCGGWRVVVLYLTSGFLSLCEAFVVAGWAMAGSGAVPRPLRSDSVRAMGSIEVIGSTVNKSSVAATGLCKPIFVAVVDEANHAIAARGGQLCSERASRAGRVERSLFGGGVSRVFGHWPRLGSRASLERRVERLSLQF